MFTFPRARGMNNLRKERCLIKFDEEKSVLTFYRRRSVFVRRYQLRYRCLCIPRHTRRTDNQASACVCIHFFVGNDDCVVIESMYVCHNEKNVSVRMMGLWKDVENIFWNILIPILISIVPRQVMYGFDWSIWIHPRQLQIYF